MSEYSGRILGKIPPTVGKDEHYFMERFCFIDCRGPLEISRSCYFGFGVKVITAGHDLKHWPEFGPLQWRPVKILDGAWVASFSILHNCTIGNHAIVSMGAVVNGITVPDYGVVVGNPGKLVGYYHRGLVLQYDKWIESRKRDQENSTLTETT